MIDEQSKEKTEKAGSKRRAESALEVGGGPPGESALARRGAPSDGSPRKPTPSLAGTRLQQGPGPPLTQRAAASDCPG